MNNKQLILKIQDFEGLMEHNPSDYILNTDNLGKAIAECLHDNDMEGVIEIIEIYLDTYEKLTNESA
jgi:hypothetical protein